jgi:nicotinate phosphoribosyltransferase
VTGPALLTDHYELTMVEAALESGVAERRAVFEVFTRRLPPGRGYGVVAGTGRLARLVEDFRFGSEELDWLAGQGFSGRLVAYLAGLRFTGHVRGHREGEVFVADTPVLVVEAPYASAQLLETLVLSVLNHDSAVAAAAARCHEVAAGRSLVEMGARRSHEQAAVDAARAAWLAGFDVTSNLAAGKRHGIPTAGTAAHSFTLAHIDEAAAFDAQVAALGAGTTLLVDTYDIREGIERAVEAARRAGGRLGAIRIDSGDLDEEARAARRQLDALGCRDTRIVLSGDLDEYRLADLASAPADAYGIGTSVVTGSGHPAAGFVYKLVAIAREPGDDAPLEPVAKTSEGKATRPGRVWPHRRVVSGVATADVLTSTPDSPPGCRPLHVPVVEGGRAAYPFDLAADRAYHLVARAELSSTGRALDAPAAALGVELALG